MNVSLCVELLEYVDCFNYLRPCVVTNVGIEMNVGHKAYVEL